MLLTVTATVLAVLKCRSVARSNQQPTTANSGDASASTRLKDRREVPFQGPASNKANGKPQGSIDVDQTREYKMCVVDGSASCCRPQGDEFGGHRSPDILARMFTLRN